LKKIPKYACLIKISQDVLDKNEKKIKINYRGRDIMPDKKPAKKTATKAPAKKAPAKKSTKK